MCGKNDHVWLQEATIQNHSVLVDHGCVCTVLLQPYNPVTVMALGPRPLRLVYVLASPRPPLLLHSLHVHAVVHSVSVKTWFGAHGCMYVCLFVKGGWLLSKIFPHENDFPRGSVSPLVLGLFVYLLHVKHIL